MPFAGRSLAAIALIALPLLGGCNRGPDDLPLAEASGQVTLDGKPLPYGIVAFHPDPAKGTAGPTGIGVVENNGTYRIRTVGREGALVGWHKVTVMAEDASKMGSPWIIPIRYGHPQRSKLEAEVKPNQKNVIPLELKSGS